MDRYKVLKLSTKSLKRKLTPQPLSRSNDSAIKLNEEIKHTFTKHLQST